MKKILLLGAQHGNEPLGDYLYSHIVTKRPTLEYYVEFAIANPVARERKVRYVESDLNRSYNGTASTLEERRADEILAFINRGNFSLVLDLHTTTCKQPPCLITKSTDHSFVDHSSIRHIVHMGHEIVRASLIGVCELAISIEVNKNEARNELFLDVLCDDIERFLAQEPCMTTKQIYVVESLLKKTDLPASDIPALRNFQKSKHGFYPILVGENSYKKQTDYLGFKAYQMYTSKV
jgi:hypothetical protein